MIGIIYKIVHTQSDICYVGMTTSTLAKRFQEHKRNHKNVNEKRQCSIYPYMMEYGVDQFKAIKIKEYEVVDRNHLTVYETLWINKLNCINKVPSFNPTPKKQLMKQYYQANKEKFSKHNKKYYDNNKERNAEKTNQYNKAYREQNREKIKEKYQANKERKFICKCGSKIRMESKSLHLRTKKHQAWLKTQNPDC